MVLVISDPGINTGFSLHKTVLKHPVSTEMHSYLIQLIPWTWCYGNALKQGLGWGGRGMVGRLDLDKT